MTSQVYRCNVCGFTSLDSRLRHDCYWVFMKRSKQALPEPSDPAIAQARAEHVESGGGLAAPWQFRYLNAELAENGSMLARRDADGRIVDEHGQPVADDEVSE